MIFKDIATFLLGMLCLCCVNIIAFIFDGEWINVAIAIDSAFIGSLSIYYFKGVSKKE